MGRPSIQSSKFLVQILEMGIGNRGGTKVFVIVKMTHENEDEYIGPFKTEETANNYLCKYLSDDDYDYNYEVYMTEEHTYKIRELQKTTRKPE